MPDRVLYLMTSLQFVRCHSYVITSATRTVTPDFQCFSSRLRSINNREIKVAGTRSLTRKLFIALVTTTMHELFACVNNGRRARNRANKISVFYLLF